MIDRILFTLWMWRQHWRRKRLEKKYRNTEPSGGYREFQGYCEKDVELTMKLYEKNKDL